MSNIEESDPGIGFTLPQKFTPAMVFVYKTSELTCVVTLARETSLKKQEIEQVPKGNKITGYQQAINPGIDLVTKLLELV